MKNLRLCGYALSSGLAAALLCGCGIGQSQSGVPIAPAQRADRHGSSSSYQVLHRFQRHRKDGTRPSAGLLYVDGALYGTSARGGIRHHGTIFRLSPSGEFQTIYRFAGGADGESPRGSLVNVNGTLYGTTAYGGASNAGTVYSVTTAGAEKVLYSFKAGPDGAVPIAGLLDVGGILYGTTYLGGAPGYSQVGGGTVFRIDTSGNETVLHRFTGGVDGAVASSALTEVKGTLYGTTLIGGSCAPSNGCGTVYSISTSGHEKVLYAFQGGADGEEPYGVVDVNGVLYGATFSGGQNGSWCSIGCGTVFSITTKGAEKTLYRFAGGSDGAQPESTLIDVNGALYGTTTIGGEGGNCGIYNGNCGTVFSVTTNGFETVLHRFAGGADGTDPAAPLVNVNGTLYGTTVEGGGHKCQANNGCGTVFSLTL